MLIPLVAGAFGASPAVAVCEAAAVSGCSSPAAETAAPPCLLPVAFVAGLAVSAALAVEGFFVNRQREVIQFHERSLAALDDTCGFLRPETAWFWLSCNFWDVQNNRVGINLASGVNESFGNENCLWVNGVLYPLQDVLFEKQDEQFWTIRSLDNRLNLSVQTSWRRYENINLRLVGSQFSQWQAKISGTIQCEGQPEIICLNEYGLLEQHYAKW